LVRVLLVNPPSPERLGSPLLGQQYVAAALLAGGCDVRVVDLAARRVAPEVWPLVAEVEQFQPDIIGFGLFTRWVWHAYAAVARLRGELDGKDRPLFVGGGAHATVRPREVLEHGFDVAVVGEAEDTIVEVARAVTAGGEIDGIGGTWVRRPDGAHVEVAQRPWRKDLDGLAQPVTAQHLWDARWYDDRASEVAPGGLLTSRGCPARCNFCANYVTGRVFRHRGADDVVHELEAWHARTGATFFPFWDDALTADLGRLAAMCETFERRLSFPLQWSAITRASMVKPALLAAMRRAGCVHVNFGVESGDDAVLAAIGKGIRTEHVVRALEWSKAEGLQTACNFMLGFPEESVSALERTLRFMQRIAPLVDTFSTLGVVVPFPGTPIYEDWHDTFGFGDWWLREEYARFEPLPDFDDMELFRSRYMDDANLALDFFRYSKEHRALIEACLRFKGEHNLTKMGLHRRDGRPVLEAHA